MKKWKCTVCGYVHDGDEPPDKCPVCGADKNKFVELSEEEAVKAEADFQKRTGKSSREAAQKSRERQAPKAEAKAAPSEPRGLKAWADRLMTRHHAHPIMVHVPNGVIPAAVLFLALGLVLDFSGLRTATFYNMILTLAAMPAVIYTGYAAWRVKYKAYMSWIIRAKIVCAVLVTIFIIGLVAWRIVDPGVAERDETRWVYLLGYLVALAPAVIAGNLGGRLVFGDD